MKEINHLATLDNTRLCLKCIGEKLRNIRIDNKLSQFDLSCLLECDKSIISALERGAYNNISIKTLQKFSYLFEVDIDYWLKS